MTKDISEESFKNLKKIDEVRDIGKDLIEFYEFLAELEKEGDDILKGDQEIFSITSAS